MKFGFFLKGQLVDSCHAESKADAASVHEHDEVHEILDADKLSAVLLNSDGMTAGLLNSDGMTVSGTKEKPISNDNSEHAIETV